MTCDARLCLSERPKADCHTECALRYTLARIEENHRVRNRPTLFTRLTSKMAVLKRLADDGKIRLVTDVQGWKLQFRPAGPDEPK